MDVELAALAARSLEPVLAVEASDGLPEVRDEQRGGHAQQSVAAQHTVVVEGAAVGSSEPSGMRRVLR